MDCDGQDLMVKWKCMKISELKKKFKNKWVLAEVIRENKRNEPVEIKPILISGDRNKIYEKMAKVPRGKTVTTLYTGKVAGSFLFKCQN